jgi:hypothetical protein
MTFIGMTALVVVLLLGVELLFRLGKRGRLVLTLVYLTWTVVDAVLAIGQNAGHEFGAFTFSFLDSIVPLVLWQWISSWIRRSKEQRKAGNEPNANVEVQPLALDTRKNPALEFIRSMPQNRITESLIAALPNISDALISEAKKTAKTLEVDDYLFVECVLDLELLGGFNKAIEFTRDKGLASAYVDAIIFSLTTSDPSAVPSEMEFKVGGTEKYRGIAKYAMAKDHYNVSFPEAWLFGKEYSQLKSGNAMDFAYVASAGAVVPCLPLWEQVR